MKGKIYYVVVCNNILVLFCYQYSSFLSSLSSSELSINIKLLAA